MFTRLSLLALACAGTLAACSTPKSPVDPAGNAWVTEQPANHKPKYGAFGGGAPVKPAAAAASAAAPAR